MTVFDDIRHTLRSLARSKLATAVLLLSLAVGTGANATLYSVMDALLFRPPPGVTGSSRLAWVHTSQFNGASYGPTSYPDSGEPNSGPFAFTVGCGRSLEMRSWR